MFRFPSTTHTILLAPKSRLGQFVSKKKSWTLPDTRPQSPLVERASSSSSTSYLTQMRISGEAFHKDAVQNSKNFEDGGGVKRGKIISRSSAPGRQAKGRFDFSENQQGMTRRAVRKLSKSGQKFGNWSY